MGFLKNIFGINDAKKAASKENYKKYQIIDNLIVIIKWKITNHFRLHYLQNKLSNFTFSLSKFCFQFFPSTASNSLKYFAFSILYFSF